MASLKFFQFTLAVLYARSEIVNKVISFYIKVNQLVLKRVTKVFDLALEKDSTIFAGCNAHSCLLFRKV